MIFNPYIGGMNMLYNPTYDGLPLPYKCGYVPEKVYAMAENGDDGYIEMIEEMSIIEMGFLAPTFTVYDLQVIASKWITIVDGIDDDYNMVYLAKTPDNTVLCIVVGEEVKPEF